MVWSSAERVADSPILRFIDAGLCTGAHLNTESLLQRLAQIMPSTLLDDQQTRLSKLVPLDRSLELLTIGIVAMTVATIASVIIHTIKNSIYTYCSVVDILHLVCARDDYIACQFAHVAFVQGLRGSTLGSVMAAPVLALISWLGSYLESNFLPGLSLRPIQIMGLGILPIGVAWWTMVTAWLTTHRSIARVL